MTPVVMQPVAVPAKDALATALDNSELRDALLGHALATLLRRLIGRPAAISVEKAHEACQETYARALQKRQEFDSSKPAGPWLHGIMNYVLMEIIRSLQNVPAQEPEDPAAWARLTANLVSNESDNEFFTSALTNIMAKLSAEHYEVVQLRFFEGLTHDKIAIRLGISIVNARVRLCRAIIAAKKIAGVDPQEDRQ